MRRNERVRLRLEGSGVWVEGLTACCGADLCPQVVRVLGRAQAQRTSRLAAVQTTSCIIMTPCWTIRRGTRTPQRSVSKHRMARDSR